MKHLLTVVAAVLVWFLVGCGLSEIEFTAASLTLETNATGFLEVEETGTKRFREQIFFVSSDESIAEVTSGGRVLAGPKPGQTTITAFSSVDYGVRGTIEVFVTEGN